MISDLEISLYTDSFEVFNISKEKCLAINKNQFKIDLGSPVIVREQTRNNFDRLFTGRYLLGSVSEFYEDEDDDNLLYLKINNFKLININLN